MEGFNQAEKYFSKAIDLAPNFGAAYGMYARTFSKTANATLVGNPQAGYKEYEVAVAAARRAVELDSRDVAAHVGVGFALETSDIQAAVASFEEALSLNPDSSLAHFGLGRILNQARQPERGTNTC